MSFAMKALAVCLVSAAFAPRVHCLQSFVTNGNSVSMKSNATNYALDPSIDTCTDDGQHAIKDKILSLLQQQQGLLPADQAAALAKMRWPKDGVEDEGTPMYNWLQQFPEEKRWKLVGLIKALHPVYFVETYLKEVRDNLLCNLKRMECMSIDDISTPIESLKGTRLIYALYDALPEDVKPQYNNIIAEIRKRFIEPMMLIKYRYTVKPSKDWVESLVPKGYPYDPIPSMPSSVEGDFDISKGGYPYVGTASLPTPNGPAYHSIKQAQYPARETVPIPWANILGPKASLMQTSLMQMAEQSRQKCNDVSSEARKIMCQLDFGVLSSKIMKFMKKKGELPEPTKDVQESMLAEMDQMSTAMAEMKETHRSACMKAKETNNEKDIVENKRKKVGQRVRLVKVTKK